MAASADVGAVLIGWAITAVGMLTLAFVFQTLANRKPELDGGVYAYAKAGFGDYMGFSSAWGYWISAWLGNVGYFVLLFSTLGYFFPIFGKGDTVAAIVCASVLLWALHFLVLRGIKEAAFINTVTTVAKIVPLFLFILICLFAFKLDIFTADIWGKSNPDLGSVMNQVRNMMLVTVCVHRHRGREHLLLPRGKTFRRRQGHRDRLHHRPAPAGAGQRAVHGRDDPAGTGQAAEPVDGAGTRACGRPLGRRADQRRPADLAAGRAALLGAAVRRDHVRRGQDHTMPEFLRRENANQVPANALWLTNICVQVFLVVVFFTSGDPDGMDPYTKMLLLATSMILIPYFWSAAYGLLLTLKGETYENDARERSKDLVIAGIAVVYAVWLLYAGGLKYLLLSALLYAPGAILFAKAKHEVGQPIFTGIEN